jgi:hypothetical protein
MPATLLTRCATERHRKAIGAIPDDGDAQQYKMKWGVKFLDEAFNAKCRIINYPPSLEDDNFIIGSTRFDVKKIKTETFKKFLPGLVKSTRVDKRDDGDGEDEDDEDDDEDADPSPPMEIVVWDEGTYMALNWRDSSLTDGQTSWPCHSSTNAKSLWSSAWVAPRCNA